MAPRARGTRARGRARGGRRSAGRSRNTADDGLPSVFQEMMMHDEAVGGPVAGVESDEARPRKRPRRAGERSRQEALAVEETMRDVDDDLPAQEVPSSPAPLERPPQTVEDDSESDLEFEDVELGGASTDEPDVLPEPMKGREEGFSVVAKKHEGHHFAKARRKRRPVTSAEKEMRLAVHKMHIMYLLYHVFFRNRWCNDEITQAMLKQIVPPRIVQLLNPDPRASQAQISTFFLLGLNQICDLFYGRFRITSIGLRRPQWLAEKDDLMNFSLHEKAEKPLELSDFRRAANSMQGSADLGAQLFCCLLRAVGVETRLVCSLQSLGFASAAEVNASSNATPGKKIVYLRDPEESEPTPQTAVATNLTTSNNGTPTPRRISRIGQPRNSAGPEVSRTFTSPSEKSTRVDRPSYPVFWVEVFNAAHQKWVAVDALATHTVGKPSRLEPGVNDTKIHMTYVIAFEENGAARDVTRRYTKAYTAKTRKLRVENTEQGTSWLRKALGLFRRPRALDRDQFEDAELTARAAAEGMPKNVQDFKRHPHYALERHLRRNEIIHPKTESGRINVGTANNPKFETVYRSSNVHIVKSADKWFRLGREIKMGEQPLKHAMPRRGTRVRESPLDPDTVEDIGVGLYAVFQTQVYVPPAVGPDGRIPKNQYGNIDVFVPSMIPEGAVWIRMAEAKHAARLLKIDYADAVTGFDFKGRHGTARIDGVVVAEAHHEAMEVACDALREITEQDREESKRRECLRLWKRFLVGMREVKRIEGYLNRDDEDMGASEMVDGEMREDDGEGGGGFMVNDDEAGQSARPMRARRVRPSDRGGGFLAGSDDDGGGFLAESDDDDGGGGGGGGFLAESDDQDSGSGGGFVPEQEEETVTEDDLDYGGGDGEGDGGGSGFLPDELEDEPPATDADVVLPTLDGTDEIIEPDSGSFGFANIRIPALSRVALSGDDTHVPSLPRVVRWMKRPRQNELDIVEQSVLIEDDTTPTRLQTGKIINDFTSTVERGDDASSMVPNSRPTSIEPDVTVVQNERQLEHEDKQELNANMETQFKHEGQGDEDAQQMDQRAVKKASENANQREAKTVQKKKEEDEPPVSSYEYDEDMPLEDPDDEDAEPEWLV